MGVYSDREIQAAIEAKQIVVHPLVPEHIRGSSVDVTLGEWYYTTELPSGHGYYNPFDSSAVDRYFGKPKQAMSHADWCKEHRLLPFEGIPDDHLISVLRPGERILAHTHEFIGINPPGTTEMKSRSSWGRNGVAACFDAGWGDPGYINRWTMEIYNLNQHTNMVLPVGERIAQIIFHRTGPVANHYGNDGKYQGGGDLQTIIDNWTPEQMLPRAYKDKRRQPLSLELKGEQA
jgi:deoxycytidine triphosphate deaminase